MPLSGLGQASEGPGGGWMDGWMYRFPLYSTGLRSLQFPPGPLPCLHSSYHHEIPQQGKGTDDHPLPLGDWLNTAVEILMGSPHTPFAYPLT